MSEVHIVNITPHRMLSTPTMPGHGGERFVEKFRSTVDPIRFGRNAYQVFRAENVVGTLAIAGAMHDSKFALFTNDGLGWKYVRDLKPNECYCVLP